MELMQGVPHKSFKNVLFIKMHKGPAVENA